MALHEILILGDQYQDKHPLVLSLDFLNTISSLNLLPFIYFIIIKFYFKIILYLLLCEYYLHRRNFLSCDWIPILRDQWIHFFGLCKIIKPLSPFCLILPIVLCIERINQNKYIIKNYNNNNNNLGIWILIYLVSLLDRGG